jgi:transposase
MVVEALRHTVTAVRWGCHRHRGGLIRRQFGVQYHFNHVGNLLRQAGWSPQKRCRLS